VVGAGVLMFTLFRRRQGEASVGRIGIGFGLMLLSLIPPENRAAPLEHSPRSLAARRARGDPFLGFFVAVALTWLIISSLTMVLFVMALAAANVLLLPLALRWCSAAKRRRRDRPLSGADRVAACGQTASP